MRDRQCPTPNNRPRAQWRAYTLLGLALVLLGLTLALPASAIAAGAATWVAQSVPAGTSNLTAVAFANASHGWAVGDDGTILATTDGGTTWKAQNSGTTDDLTAVAFPNATDGWAVGDDSNTGTALILATTDGGTTWSPQYADATDDLTAVAFPNATDGWAVGDDSNTGTGLILATTDGGTTWSPQYADATDYPTAVAFANASDGWAVGSGPTGLILTTTDGGTTWSPQGTTAPGDLSNFTGYSVTCADATHAWAVCDDGNWNTILATTDGGDTWNVQSAGADTIADLLNSITCADATHAWAVGLGQTGGVILTTSDGGATWTAQNSGTAGQLTGVTCVGSTHAWAVGEGAGTGVILAMVMPPTLIGFTPASGVVGSSMTLSGTGFSGATSVSFNGAAATFVVNSDTKITAPVPAGAASGPITITTPGGTATSAAGFTVVVAPKLTLKLSGLTDGALKLGKSLTAKGTMTPTGLAGCKVTLAVQRKQDGKWLKVKSMARTMNASCCCRWTYKPAKKDSYRVQATIAKTAANTAATTPWRMFKVK